MYKATTYNMSEEAKKTTEVQTPPPPAPEVRNEDGVKITVIIYVLIIFVILGILALVWSFVCLGKSGTPLEKSIGVILAFFTGPFYFIYYGFNPNYCRNNSVGNVGGKKRRK